MGIYNFVLDTAKSLLAIDTFACRSQKIFNKWSTASIGTRKSETITENKLKAASGKRSHYK
jgi:hypothetical protein